MKKFNKVVLALGAVFALTGCNQTCTYAEFKEAATTACSKNHGYNTAIVKMNDKEYTGTYKVAAFVCTDVAATAAFTAINTVRATIVTEIEGATYKKGDGFEWDYTTDEKNYHYVWNGFGLLTNAKTPDIAFTVSYK